MIQLFGERAWLEPLARQRRFAAADRYLPTGRSLKVADIGCGFKPNYFTYLRQKHDRRLAKYVGLDPRVAERAQQVGGVKMVTRKIKLGKRIPLTSAGFDWVCAFAFLEHVDYPAELLAEMVRISRPGGAVAITVPSPRAKLILETLAFRLGLISKREIAEHRRYFDRDSLLAMIPNRGRKKPKAIHNYFEGGLNNLLIIRRGTDYDSC